MLSHLRAGRTLAGHRGEAVLADAAIAKAARRDRPLRSVGAGGNEEEEEWRMIC